MDFSAFLELVEGKDDGRRRNWVWKGRNKNQISLGAILCVNRQRKKNRDGSGEFDHVPSQNRSVLSGEKERQEEEAIEEEAIEVEGEGTCQLVEKGNVVGSVWGERRD